MSSGKKLSKFCKISLWIRHKDDEFYEAIRDLCMEGSINLRRGKAGLTFVMPPSQVRREIVSHTYSDSPEKAVDLLKAHIIYYPVSLPLRNKESSSSLRIKLSFKESGGKIVVNDSVELTPARDFKSDNKKLYVYEANTKMPTEGEKVKDYREGSKRTTNKKSAEKGEKKGGYENTPDEMDEVREQMGRMADAAYARNSSMKVYNSAVVSFLNYLSERRRELFDSVVLSMDSVPITSFYILFEPHCKGRTNKFIPDELIRGWLDTRPGVFDTFAKDMENLSLEDLLNLGCEEFTDPSYTESHRKMIEEMRQMDEGIKVLSDVEKAYKSVMGRESFRRARAFEHMGTDVGSKCMLWQDVFRFTAVLIVRSEVTDPQGILSALHNLCGEKYGVSFMDKELIIPKSNVDPSAELGLAVSFVDSSDFLYTYIPNELDDCWGDLKVENTPSKRRDHIFNTEGIKSAARKLLLSDHEPRRREEVSGGRRYDEYMENVGGEDLDYSSSDEDEY